MALDLSGGDGGERLAGSQILVWMSGAPEKVAGLELGRRAIYTACRAGFEHLLILVEGGSEALRRENSSDPRLRERRCEVMGRGEGWVEAVSSTGGRWVVFSDRWIVDAAHLRELAETRGRLAAAAVDGPLAADAGDLVALAAQGWTPGRPVALPIGSVEKPVVYVRVSAPSDVPRAEDALFESLARNTTNPFARYVDRAMSRALSRRLAPHPITPNQITIFSILLGIAGALLLLRPTYAFGLLGSFLFLASTVIDGCDGEIARLKFQESAKGARLDVIGDNVVHAFLFPCVALHAYFADPEGPYLLLGAIAFAGVVFTWLAVYWVVVRNRPSKSAEAIFEVFGNREFAYLFFFLGLAGRLHWFVWWMAFGLWAFPLALFATVLTASR